MLSFFLSFSSLISLFIYLFVNLLFVRPVSLSFPPSTLSPPLSFFLLVSSSSSLPSSFSFHRSSSRHPLEVELIVPPGNGCPTYVHAYACGAVGGEEGQQVDACIRASNNTDTRCIRVYTRVRTLVRVCVCVRSFHTGDKHRSFYLNCRCAQMGPLICVSFVSNANTGPRASCIRDIRVSFSYPARKE